MQGGVTLTELLTMPLGPVWRDRILLMEAAEIEADTARMNRGHSL